MNANTVPVEVVVGPSEYFRLCFAKCLPNSSRLSTSNARCVRSGWTCTGPLPGKLVISISSLLSGALRKTSSDPRGDLCLLISLRSEEHTSELQSLRHLVCRPLL